MENNQDIYNEYENQTNYNQSSEQMNSNQDIYNEYENQTNCNQSSEQMNYNQTCEQRYYTPASIGEWVKRYLLLCIPIVNIVMLIIWCTNKQEDIGKQLWAKATAIFLGIFLGIYFLFIIGVSAIFLNLKTTNLMEQELYEDYQDYDDDFLDDYYQEYDDSYSHRA